MLLKRPAAVLHYHIPQVQFLYFNAANYAVKSTVEAGSESLVSLAGNCRI